MISRPERSAGVEPASPPWEDGVIPLHHERLCSVADPSTRRESNPHDRATRAVRSRYVTGATIPSSPRQESNLRVRLTKAASCRYTTGAALRQCPRQESNLVRDLRKVECDHHTPRTAVPQPGVEPGLRPSESRVHPLHHRGSQSVRRESNPRLHHGKVV